jgi:hypothetical protein
MAPPTLVKTPEAASPQMFELFDEKNPNNILPTVWCRSNKLTI